MPGRLQRLTISVILYSLLLILLSLIPPPTTRAATFTISNGDVAGLIAAINLANNSGVPNTIELAAGGNYTLTNYDNIVQGSGGYPNTYTGLPIIRSDLTINGNGATISRSRANGVPSFRIFYVVIAGFLKLNDLTISNGLTLYNYAGESGGLFNNHGTVTINNCVFINNSGGAVTNTTGAAGTTGPGGTANLTVISSTFLSNPGGSIVNIATLGGSSAPSTVNLTVYNSTFASNAGGFNPGGIDNEGGGSLTPTFANTTVINSTFFGNSSNFHGSAFYNLSLGLGKSSAVVTNSTFSSNSPGTLYSDFNFGGQATFSVYNNVFANNAGTNCDGGIFQGSNNLEFSTPFSCGAFSSLSPVNPLSNAGLSNNGGPTQTIALASPPNPAIKGANPVFCPTTDQRGVLRKKGVACDIGAYEAMVSPDLTKTFSPFGIASGDTSDLIFSLSNSNSLPLNNVSFTDNLPSQLTIATSPSLINDCGTATIIAVAGGDSISVSGLTLASNFSCLIKVKVTSTTPGTWSNTTSPISANETGTGAISNTATLSVFDPLIVTTLADNASTPPPGSLRQAVSIAANQGGGLITFSNSLGQNPQITLEAPLVIASGVLIEASCANKVQLTANFANSLQLQGKTLIRGLRIYSPAGSAIKITGDGNHLECTKTRRIPFLA